MKKPLINLSSLSYLLVAALCLIYEHYFVSTLYFKPRSQYYDLFINIHTFVSVQSLYFSVAAFITVVIYTIISFTISKIFRKYFLIISVLILLVYLVLALLSMFGLKSVTLVTTFFSIHPIIFAVLGFLYAVGVHEKNSTDE